MHRTKTPQGTVRLRAEQFRRHAELSGLTTDGARAEHLGVSRWTVMRLLNGDIEPGTKFIAQTLLAFPERRFEDFFEVVEIREAKGSAA